MKGIVFTEFMDMVEEVFSAETLDLIIDKSQLPNEGAYTAVGTYPHQEIVTMVSHLSEEVNMPEPALLEAFGGYLFKRFIHLFPMFFEGQTSAFGFLKGIDNYIHVEVKKLYPEAELPRFYYVEINRTTLELYYLSSRHFEDLAIGLIKGCCEHFQQPCEISCENTLYEGEEAIKITLNQTA